MSRRLPKRSSAWEWTRRPQRQLAVAGLSILVLSAPAASQEPLAGPVGPSEAQRFERAVFGARVAILAEYWNREYFRGVPPPVTLTSHEAMLRFVANEPRAIGYLPTQLVNASVHVAARLEPSTPADLDSLPSAAGERLAVGPQSSMAAWKPCWIAPSI